MVSITVSIPEETKKLMREFDEMNWSGFVRKAIERKAEQLKKIEALKAQLATEQTDWAVRQQRQLRLGRAAQLRKKGLL